jgi:predicted RNA-binding protein (virulence factor B family)
VLYKNEVFQPLNPGQRLTGYIKKVRSDQKIDLTCHKPGLERVDELAERILAFLREHGGFLPLTDSSPPESIHQYLGESKKTYKKAIGVLFKKRLIVIDPDGIRLQEPAAG